MQHNEPDRNNNAGQEARRDFLKQSTLLTALSLTPSVVVQAAEKHLDEKAAAYFEQVTLKLTINGKPYTLSVEPRVTLLDLLRERLNLTGTKKGCDYGQCGACTVHIDGRRTLSCLTFAVMHEGQAVTTIEGLAEAGPQGKLHPVQEAFIRHDGFQCGYCTPGQIMSAIGCLREDRANSPDEIREYMSGNICRCGAYNNIVDAIAEVKKGGQKV
ncbi:(2Fe-2S)-binding protein [Arsenicibacter rosenii]|uniref:2Fe-2S ferredoxin n=1 Tax=Arsenicibacter rosenii TaxID=1750698 RepID=A0A1S2VNR3_9BACT|nr:(2Fe-2S)-binding protein [Arsenicibacter rosenii]OIN60417.1 2Fe-2S ferredoxin [Arsenicibacter rosenii]